METSVTAVVVTYNPNGERFKEVIENLTENCQKIIIIDNGSLNFGEISSLSKISFRFQQNVGIAKALNKGCKIALDHGNPDWILTLDQDSILSKNAVGEVLEEYSKLNARTKSRVGIVALAENEGNNKGFKIVDFEITSGNLVKASLLQSKSFRFREDFFMDQIDFDFDIQVRNLGFVILKYQKKLMNHQVGSKLKVGEEIVPYENAQRLYYLTRNSTALLFHGLPFKSYFWQLEKWNLNYTKVNGMRSAPKLMKILTLGVTHSILHKFGKFDLQ